MIFKHLTHLSIQKLGKLVSALLIVVLFGMLGNSLFSTHALQRLSDEWETYMFHEARKLEHLSNLSVAIGYSGMIHHFKNYILRQDPKYLEMAHISHIQASREISALESMAITDKEREQLTIIRNTLEHYHENILLAQALIEAGTPIAEVDRQVKIDDGPAHRAMMAMKQNIIAESAIKRGNAYDFLVERSKTSVWMHTLILLVLGVIASFIFWATNTLLIHPIQSIRDAVVKLRSGEDLAQRIYTDKYSPVELQNLAEGINEMLETIELSHGALKRARANLEEKVAERTRELNGHKENLELMIQEQTKDIILAKEAAEEANEVKSRFLANISHELRTPMHAILSFSNIAIKKINTGKMEKIPQYLGNIHESGERLLRLVNDLLDLSKLESGKMELSFQRYNLAEIADDVCMELESLFLDKHLTIHCEYEGRYDCMADATRIRQVLVNLLSNAIKFSPEASIITLRMAHICLAADGGGEMPAIRLEVDDQGAGIPEGEQDIIFDAFTQSSATATGAGGTGLGLPICREIIEAHKGRIWAENRPEGGARLVCEILTGLPNEYCADTPFIPLTVEEQTNAEGGAFI